MISKSILEKKDIFYKESVVDIDQRNNRFKFVVIYTFVIRLMIRKTPAPNIKTPRSPVHTRIQTGLSNQTLT